jgi:hypothetical protein
MSLRRLRRLDPAGKRASQIEAIWLDVILIGVKQLNFSEQSAPMLCLDCSVSVCLQARAGPRLNGWDIGLTTPVARKRSGNNVIYKEVQPHRERV